MYSMYSQIYTVSKRGAAKVTVRNMSIKSRLYVNTHS